MSGNSKIWWFTRLLLKSFMDNYDFYFLSGDLEEVYLNKKIKKGKFAAETWLLFQVIISLPPILTDNLFWSLSMLKSYIKIAYRNIIKNKVYSFINIFGLSIGLTCCLIIFLFVKYELSFDSFHSKADQIYRINSNSKTPDGISKESCTRFPLANTIRNDFPQLEAVTHVFAQTGVQLEVDEKTFSQDDIVFADTSFFNVFDYEFVLGSPEGMFKNPGDAVLTETTANKLFGDESPLGKTFTLNKQLVFNVAGVIKDPPQNSSLPVQMFASIYALTNEFAGIDLDSWGQLHSGSRTYILLPENTNIESIEKQLPEFMKKNFPPEIVERSKYVFQPLKEIHVNTEYGADSLNYITSMETIVIFSIVGLLTLLIASINFINLSIAQSIKRAKEVGMRKVIGANRNQLFRQFMGETFVYTLCSFLISVLLANLLMPYAGNYLGNNSELSLFDSWEIGFYLLGVFIIVNLLTGFYPSIILSRFNPIEAFRNKITGKKTGVFSLRNGLVVFQFVISQILIVSTIIVSYQLEYVKNKDLGFNKQKIVTVDLPDINDVSKFKVYKNKLLQNTNISDVSLSGGAPLSDLVVNTFFSKIPEEGEERFNVWLKPVDENYIKTFGLKLLAGEPFKEHVEGDTVYKFVINETMMKKLGITDPEKAVGQKFKFSRVVGQVQGVVKDFHTASLQSEIKSVALSNMYQKFFMQAQVKIKTLDDKAVIDYMKSAWEDLFPDYTFNFNYLEEYINNLYSVEENFFNIIKVFAVLAILIGCLGLIGLVSFVTIQKTKEIGVRKVLGASVSNILTIISKEFTINVLFANLIAWPVAWYFMNDWLQGFAYRVSIEWWMFAAAGLAALIITLITVSFQSVKAAYSNPVEALKYE